jgi:3-deoxy-D-arabino-heptulosonate 7-phosphate (DAHP) synthase class II
MADLGPGQHTWGKRRSLDEAHSAWIFVAAGPAGLRYDPSARAAVISVLELSERVRRAEEKDPKVETIHSSITPANLTQCTGTPEAIRERGLRADATFPLYCSKEWLRFSEAVADL